MNFTVPAGVYNSNEATNFIVDRNPQEATKLRVIEYSADNSPLKQQRVDGINFRNMEIAFAICCQTVEEFTLLDRYFRSLRGVLPITLNNSLTGGVSRQIQITEWSISRRNSIYGDMQVRGKLCY